MSGHRNTGEQVSRRTFIQRSVQTSLAASLFANWGCTPSGPGETPSKPPNVLFISMDTTRADHMSCYGYARKTTPALDALAESSLFFKRAVSTSSWTLPAHASMFTGKFVTSHGARKYEEGAVTLDEALDSKGTFNRYRANTIRQDETLLAEILKGAGYETGAVIAGPWLKKVFGLHRGFDFHDDELEFTDKRIGMEVTGRGLRWLESVGEKPFFLFLNYFDPHTPYRLPNQFKPVFDGTPNPGLHEHDQIIYDHEILFMDWCIGILFDNMKKLGLFDNTLIVAIGDHGELFGDHGRIGHGQFLYQGDIHVPLMVRYPQGEIAPAVRDEFVQPIDLMPLILDRLNLPLPSGAQGSPLEMISHPILAEVYPLEADSPAGHWQALIDNGLKLLFNTKGSHELYDLIQDPREEHNLAASNPDKLHEMIAKLLTHLENLPRPEGSPAPIEIDDATLQELESMGYL